MDLPLTGCTKNVPIATTEISANRNSILVEKISDNLASIPVQRLLEIMDISSIMRSFTSDNLFLKNTFTSSLKPLHFARGLIPRAESIVVPPMFTTDISI